MRTRGENAGRRDDREMTVGERITLERARHATHDPRCEACLKVRKAIAEAAYFDHATVKNSQQSAKIKIRVGTGPRGETFARAVHRKRAQFEDLELFLKVLQTH